MIRLCDLSAPAVSLEWHEAVAVVAALTAAVWNARLSQAPALDAAVLTPEGVIAIEGSGRLPGAVTSGLAVALGTLLESTPCPAELRQLVTSNLGPDPELDTVNAFSRALMFFERPGREDVVRELARRAATALEAARASAELERLTERARSSAEHAVLSSAVLERPVAASARRMVAPAAVGTTIFIAVALAAATLFTTAQAPDSSSVPAVGLERARDDAAPPDAAVESPRSPAAPATVSPGPASSPGRSRTPGARTNRTGAELRTTAPTTVTPRSATDTARSTDTGVVVTVTELGGAPLPADATTPAPSARTVSARVYTASDVGVSPAVLVKPHLPAEPPSDVPPWEVGTLVITVAPSGAVEQVHLITPYNRYQERMLVAAAKAWLFEPATKDGRPVRFRTRIRVTL